MSCERDYSKCALFPLHVRLAHNIRGSIAYDPHIERAVPDTCFYPAAFLYRYRSEDPPGSGVLSGHTFSVFFSFDSSTVTSKRAFLQIA